MSLAVLVLAVGSAQYDGCIPFADYAVGVQRGTEQVVTFSGHDLADAEEIFFYQQGVEVTKLEPVNANSFKAHLKIAADCKLGEYVTQVRCKSGLTEYAAFYVGPLSCN